MKRFLKKTTVLSMLCTAVASLSGCDEQAIEFAKKTKDILDQRSAQIAKKIAAEEEAYNMAVVSAAENHRALVDSSLQNERNERADALAADYAEGRKPVSLWRKDLAEYAKIDYTANRELLTEEMDAKSRFLQNFQALKIEQDKVDALSKLLAALAKKPSLKSDIAALSSFAKETQQDFDQKVCTQLQSQMNGNDSAVKAAATKAFNTKNCKDIVKSK